MATTTPNFGWSVPTSTDLVKDGATAIETLGDAIDASLVDLKGGTSGQVLAKNSNTDMDFTWTTPASGATFAGVGLYRTANQNLTSPAYTMIQWNAEEFDTNSFHDNATNNTRITIPTGKGGKYLVTAQVTISSAVTSGSRFIVLYKNGSFYGSNYYAASASYYAGGGQDFSLNFAVTVTLAAADYIEIGYYQNSGSTIVSETSSNHFTATYLGA